MLIVIYNLLCIIALVSLLQDPLFKDHFVYGYVLLGLISCSLLLYLKSNVSLHLFMEFIILVYSVYVLYLIYQVYSMGIPTIIAICMYALCILQISLTFRFIKRQSFLAEKRERVRLREVYDRLCKLPN